jgi:hypothetical protein
MTYHEIDTYVREHTDIYRLYDWKQVEGMRNDLSRYAFFEVLYERVSERHDSVMKAISALMEELRAGKQYNISDKLRAIIEFHEV